MQKELHKLEAALGYHFQQPDLLVQALTHRSSRPMTGENLATDNERLEFLGDRVLGLIVSQHLCDSFPEWDVGALAKGLSRLVSASSIQAAASALALGEFLHLGRGEELTGGREKRNLLADAYEAVVAAIYLDGGFLAALAFVRRTLIESEAAGARAEWSETDDKSALQEWLQKRGKGAPQYKVVRESGPDHCKLFTIELWLDGKPLATSEGRSKKEAEQDAARRALLFLKSNRTAAAGEV